jgi:DNA-binding response OmpR family regulator
MLMNPRRYLLISGTDASAKALVRAVMDTGDELAVARDPLEAVGLIQNAPPDAVLWAMDAVDEESVVACRTLRRHSQAPIVLLVDSSAKEDVLRGYRLGADAHIAMPCDRREFNARVKAVLRRTV